ncbi:MAG: hypothetical protein ACRCU0_07795 [Candidatus Rhabdochlamydia sp.]
MADVINQDAAKKSILMHHEWDAIEKREDEEDIREANRAFKNFSKKQAISLKIMKKKLKI